MPIVKLADGRSVNTELLTQGQRVKYGRVFREGVSLLTIELAAFREDWPEAGGRAACFKRLETTLWPDYIPNEWSDKQNEALCSYDLIAFMGCAGSGKSRKLSHYALCVWWSAPQDTAIVVTSTDIESARARIWGHIMTAFRTAQWVDDEGIAHPTPGCITDQPTAIRLSEKTDEVRGAGQESIRLVAAGNDAREAALKTLQGLHNKLVILILDELQSLTPSIIGPVLENLRRNPRFQLVAAGNIGEVSDPLGTLCRPVTPDDHGYDDVGPDILEWPIERNGLTGVCVRFDAEHSPNLDYYERGLPEPYPFLPTFQELANARFLFEQGRKEAADWWRQWRAMPVPASVSDNRWSANAILRFHGSEFAKWATPGGFLMGAGCDPAYSSGGDRFVLKPGRYGQLDNGMYGIEFLPTILLQHDESVHGLRNYSMVFQARDWCLKEGITPQYFAVDASGENPIADLFAQEWSLEILRVSFSGKASDRPITMTDRRPCHDEYSNFATELWCVSAEFLRHDQLRGISETHQKELITRKVERGAGNKLVAESKKKMKIRTGGVSPDEADGGNILVEVFRQRAGAVPGSEGIKQIKDAWNTVAKKVNVNPVRLTSMRGIQSTRRRY